MGMSRKEDSVGGGVSWGFMMLHASEISAVTASNMFMIMDYCYDYYEYYYLGLSRGQQA